MNSSPGPRWLGKYQLRELLGQGGIAEVWKGWDTQLQRPVAIKLLHADVQNDPEFLKRFEREAQMVASLHHPNIIQVHDFQVMRLPELGNIIAFMVMEYIEGPTLAKYLAQCSDVKQLLAPAQIVQLFASLSSAVDYAHLHNMIHHDIKPANILLDQTNITHNVMGEPILTDFGIARLMNSTTGMQSEWWHGTELYMSPEQAKGYPGNERSDIYSLGVILYEVCTGVQPFRGKSSATIMQQHMHIMPISPAMLNPALPPSVTQVILHCMAKEPEKRYGDAASMVAALAKGFSVQMPETLGQINSSLDEMNETTYILPRRPGLAQNIMPHSSIPPLVDATSFPSYGTLPTSQIDSMKAQHSTPVTPPIAYEGMTPISRPGIWTTEGRGYSGNHTSSPIIASPPMVSLKPMLPTPLPMQKKRRRGLLFVLIALVLIGGSLGTFYTFSKQTPVVPPNKQLVGQAFFVSSGQLREKSNQGINDELQINLSNIPEPGTGKDYYVWLLKDKNEPDATAIKLGTITIVHGNVHFLYAGDAQHSNLLEIASRVLITEEDANSTPINPSPDQSTWRYYAELPQAPDPKDISQHFSVLDHLRKLLVEDTKIETSGLHGGLNIWLLRNVEKLLEWSGSARDYWGDANSRTLLYNQLIRILDTLDGEVNVQSDVPPNTHLLVSVPVGLLGTGASDMENQGTTDYLHIIIGHLNAIAQAPGVTPEERTLTAQINMGLDNLTNWLEQVRQDAKKLIRMTDAQLLLPSTLPLLDAMQINAFYAYVGRLDPATNHTLDGTTQIYYEEERLATFDFQAYKAP